jgi:hypothetical protein
MARRCVTCRRQGLCALAGVAVSSSLVAARTSSTLRRCGWRQAARRIQQFPETWLNSAISMRARS